jgi:O-antigen ligase
VVAVTSRGSILATGTFLAIYYGIYKGTFKATAYAVGGVLFASLVLSAFPGLREMIFEDVMKLSDKSRGLGSGFTGRFDMWVQALEEFWKRPVFGYGFRTSSMQIGSDFGGVHSAYIKILLEGGFVGAILVIATAVVELIRRLRLATRLRTMGANEMPGMDLKESFRVNAICCASLCLLLTLWIYDQYYINLGSPISIIFFLVITAPTFITSQGITTRRPEHIARRIALTGRPA